MNDIQQRLDSIPANSFKTHLVNVISKHGWETMQTWDSEARWLHNRGIGRKSLKQLRKYGFLPADWIADGDHGLSARACSLLRKIPGGIVSKEELRERLKKTTWADLLKYRNAGWVTLEEIADYCDLEFDRTKIHRPFAAMSVETLISLHANTCQQIADLKLLRAKLRSSITSKGGNWR